LQLAEQKRNCKLQKEKIYELAYKLIIDQVLSAE